MNDFIPVMRLRVTELHTLSTQTELLIKQRDNKDLGETNVYKTVS